MIAKPSHNLTVSDDEAAPEILLGKPKKLDFGILPKKSRTTRSTRSTENVYEVPDSGDELESAKKTKAQEDSIPATSSKRKVANNDGKSSPSRPTTRHRDGQESGVPLTGKEDKVAPRKRGRPPKAKVNEAVYPLAVKARVYGFTGKAGLGVAPDPPKLKGILSPQKKKVGRPPKKTVVFDEGDGIDSGMPDRAVTPRPVLFAVTKTGSQRTEELSIPLDTDNDKEVQDTKGEKEEEGEDEAEEDDEVCAICSKPESKRPNEIIFCEVCDRGFHQKCYNVPVIPEGDWICRTCSQEDVLPDVPHTTEKHASPTILTEVPEIPNFKRHFEKTRRTLLDRCSANRRIKLRGQNEAYDKAYQLVEQTVLAGEGNSMMVIGGRGCGKTIVGLILTRFVSLLISMPDDGRDHFQPPSRALRRFPRRSPQWFHSYR
jgi:origin recognition complex subunit 4